MKTQNFVILLFILFIPTLAFSAAQNVFLEIRKTEIIIGEYSSENYKAKELAVYSRTQYYVEEIVDLILGNANNEKVLFYIHSMWGGFPAYHQSSLQKLNEINGVDRIVSIVWHTQKLSYRGSWELAINSGKSIADIMQELTSCKDNENYMLCHSMGHRLLEGMAVNWKDIPKNFSGILLAAADLDIDVFNNNMKYLPGLTDKIVIYVNEKDKWLRPSKWIHRKGRLGLNGAQNSMLIQTYSNIVVVDVTNRATPGLESARSHIYFKQNARVLQDIESVINAGTKSGDCPMTAYRQFRTLE